MRNCDAEILPFIGKLLGKQTTGISLMNTIEIMYVSIIN